MGVHYAGIWLSPLKTEVRWVYWGGYALKTDWGNSNLPLLFWHPNQNPILTLLKEARRNRWGRGFPLVAALPCPLAWPEDSKHWDYCSCQSGFLPFLHIFFLTHPFLLPAVSCLGEIILYGAREWGPFLGVVRKIKPMSMSGIAYETIALQWIASQMIR